jgi:hypothetical protein
VLLVCRFDVPQADAAAFAARARRALDLLRPAVGFVDGTVGRAIDEPQRWVLSLRFTGVDAYRRALSPFPVREHVIPLLSEALADEPATYETRLTATPAAVAEHRSLLAD